MYLLSEIFLYIVKNDNYTLFQPKGNFFLNLITTKSLTSLKIQTATTPPYLYICRLCVHFVCL